MIPISLEIFALWEVQEILSLSRRSEKSECCLQWWPLKICLVYLGMHVIFTDFQQCNFFSCWEICGHHSYAEKCRRLSTPHNTKYNYAILFVEKCIGYVSKYISDYHCKTQSGCPETIRIY